MRNQPRAIRAAPTLPSWTTLQRGACLVAARAGGVLGQMGAQIAVGALAGPTGIGALQLQMSWTALLGEVVGGGEPTRSMRDTAVAAHAGAVHHIRRSLVRGATAILLYSTLAGLLLGTLGMCGLHQVLDVSQDFLWLSIALAAPLFALTRLLAETLKALDKALLAVTIENSAVPMTLLAICAAIGAGSYDAAWHLRLLLGATVAGALLAASTLTWALRRALRKQRQDTRHAAQTPPQPTDGRDQLHFWLTGLLNIAFLQLPFLILPWMVSADDVGRFAVAHKLVNIITTLLILLSAVYGPRFARAAAAGDGARAKKYLRETQILSLSLFVPVWLTLLSLASPLASLFSLESSGILEFLLILGAGQFINAATGLSGVALNMSGAAHRESAVLIISLSTTIAIAALLGWTWGALGIAGACAGGIALRNLASYGFAVHHLQTLETKEL